ncbi:MAG TPA: hypothetical protein VN697_03165, partial [Tepidiformaceae bacterium]|nr:hypothetical protein [Tepidiformaceae bacterium]
TQCDDHAPRRKRVEELGIRIVTQFEVPGHFRNMQLHPKDTGGSFFEIDRRSANTQTTKMGRGTPRAAQTGRPGSDWMW